MSNNKVTIAFFLTIWLGFDSKNHDIKNHDHDMKNIHFGSISVRLLTLKRSASFWKFAKIGQK